MPVYIVTPERIYRNGVPMTWHVLPLMRSEGYPWNVMVKPVYIITPGRIYRNGFPMTWHDLPLMRSEGYPWNGQTGVIKHA